MQIISPWDMIPKYLDLFKQKLNERLWLPNTLVQLLFKKIIKDLKREQNPKQVLLPLFDREKNLHGVNGSKTKMAKTVCFRFKLVCSQFSNGSKQHAN